MSDKELDIKNFSYTEVDDYLICNECFSDSPLSVISLPRSITYGGTFDRKHFKFEEVKDKIDFMLIGQNPWFNNNKDKENVYGRAFGDKSEKILIEYLDKVKIDASRIWVTNTVQCSVLNNEPALVIKAFQKCKYRILEEIKQINPKVLVPMGNVTYDLLQEAIREFDIKIKVVKILHPNALGHNPSLADRFEEQLKKLKGLL